MSLVRNAVRLPSRQALLVGSVGLDVVWRLPEDVVAPLLSLLGGVIDSPTVATITSWVMFAVALYSLAHLAYPQDRLPTDTPGFRLCFVAGTLPFALVVHSESGTAALLLSAFGTCVLAGGVLMAYLRRYHGWAVLDPGGPMAGLVEFTAPAEDGTEVRAELRADLTRGGAVGALGTGMYLSAVAVLLSLPCIAAGIAIEILFDTFPIPDLLFLAWGVAGAVVPRLGRGPSQTWIDDRAVDFQESLLDSVENVTRSVTGLVLGLYSLLGIFGFGVVLYGAMEMLPTVGTAADSAIGLSRSAGPTVSEFALAWNAVGVPVTLLFSGGFGLWAWMRAFRRLPRYLDRWEGRDLADERRIARPPGFVAVPLAGPLLVRWYHFGGAPASLLFGLGWPLLLAVGLLAVSRTRTVAPQPVDRDDVVILLGIVAQTLAMWTVTVSRPLVDVLTETPSAALVPMIVCGLGVFLWAVPKLDRIAADGSWIDRCLPGVQFVGVGLAAGLSRSIVSSRAALVFSALSVGCVAFGALWIVADWLDR